MTQDNSTDSKYIPNENEKYMNLNQLEFFKNKLNLWKENLIIKNNQINSQMIEIKGNILNQNAFNTNQELQQNLLTEKSNNNNTINKINAALLKIKQKTFGYCEHLNIPIGVKRLIAIPITRYSLEAQIELDNMKK